MRFSLRKTSGDDPGVKGQLKTKSGWEIEIASLEELIELLDKEQSLVLETATLSKTELPLIEIYDDYRE